MGSVRMKRIYDDPSPDDGFRVLVDRIWPRGMSKERARIDEWMKELAPSAELRKWFQHDPEKFPLFRKQYLSFLEENEECRKKLKELKERLKVENVTLLYSAKDERHNQAVVLREFILESSR
ncbi:DUF488 domain-containing protein [Siminovitchia fordii]|uniref:DUF488 domain-containing protein n=1 Tax=Siminovitchia fordii TaxID=254759 RepID=A0ABQ4K6K3_9BACI|nr:DUF488 domain-containing protein [Siminovitchia fordii]GIN21359.1 hypothetical protein J1TS3_24930 [Siminovitchia fordii]